MAVLLACRVLAQDLASDIKLLAALAALLLLPGLMLVRAPWSAIPFVSLAFWLVTWGWIPLLGSRLAFVQASLLFSGLLSALRLPRLEGVHRPRLGIALVAGVALLLLAPLALRDLAPGAGAPFRALTVRLLVWRDGLPLTYEPLLGVHRFGPALQAVDLLAADVALLAGGSPARAACLAQLAVLSLLLVACFESARRFARPWLAAWDGQRPDADPGAADSSAAYAVVTAFCLLGWALVSDQLVAGAPWNVPSLEVACAVMALAWLGRGRGRGAALAAGLALAAVLVGRPRLLWPLVLATSGLLAVRLAWATTPPARRALGVRHAWALAATFVAVAPAWWHLHACGRLQTPALAWESGLPGLALLVFFALLAACAARPCGYVLGALAPGARAFACTALALATLAGWACAWRAAPGWPEPTPEQARRWPRLTRALDPLAPLCIDARGPGAWLPALGGQAVMPMPVPHAAWPALGALRGQRTCLPAPAGFELAPHPYARDGVPALVPTSR